MDLIGIVVDFCPSVLVIPCCVIPRKINCQKEDADIIFFSFQLLLTRFFCCYSINIGLFWRVHTIIALLQTCSKLVFNKRVYAHRFDNLKSSLHTLYLFISRRLCVLLHEQYYYDITFFVNKTVLFFRTYYVKLNVYFVLFVPLKRLPLHRQMFVVSLIPFSLSMSYVYLAKVPV